MVTLKIDIFSNFMNKNQMDKFVISNNHNKKKTGEREVIADRDGALIELYRNFLNKTEASDLFKELKETVGWKVGETMTKGGMKATSRLVMGMASADLIDKLPDKFQRGFTPLLNKARHRIEELTGETYNFAYLNLYRDGNDHVGFHSDKEDSLLPDSTIASLSLGMTRDFMIRHSGDTRLAQEMSGSLRLEYLEKARQTIPLEPGHLLLMRKKTQKIYQHHVPKRPNVKGVRINITFRRIHDTDTVGYNS